MSQILERSRGRLTGFLLAAAVLLVQGAAGAGEVLHDLTLTFDRAALELGEVDGETVVRYRGGLAAARAPGSPALPAVTVYVEGPAAATVGRVEAEVLDAMPLGVHRLGAAQPDAAVGGPAPKTVALDPAIAVSAAAYPAEVAAFAGRSAMRGRHLLAFTVHPVRWRPRTGELELVTRVQLRYTLVPAPSLALERHRVVPGIERRFARGLAGVVTGADGAAAPDEAVLPPGGVAGPGPFQPTFRPTPDGSAVEYVIVTSQALAGEFERLADWKTQKGVQAAVRTVEWIDQTYPNGVDRAERVRFFIRDAYQNWGTLFVLLGGDTDIVPVRYAFSTLLGGEMIPSDYYYMCLEGNWNADGDTRFGEGFELPENPGDAADLMPEVYAGRAPVSTLAQAQVFVTKTIDYDKNPAGGNGYPASILYLAERLFLSVDGATIAEAADAIVPAWFKRVKLYEEYQSWPGSLPETRQSAIDSTNHGFGIVHHIGHGYRNTMSVGDGVLNNADADALLNGARQSVVFAINCSAASIDFNSIGERWVKNANGGAIAYIGTSRFAFVNSSRDYQGFWYRKVFADSVRSLGEVCALARLPMVPSSEYDNTYRWTLFALTLLGDPEVDIYTAVPAPLAVAHAGSYALGSGPFTATATSGGSPVDSATVTLWKAGEAYAVGLTGANGQVSFPFPAETAGPATLTVHKSYYHPYQATVNVTAAGGPYPYVQALAVDDDDIGGSTGDGDGLADAGETIELRVTLKNGGGAALTGASATLTAADPGGHLTLTTGTVSYGTIGAGGSSQGAGPFVIEIDPAAPEAFQPVFTLAVTADQGSFSDAFVLPVRRTYLEHYAHEIDDAVPRGNGNGIVEAGEEIWYRVSMRNTGQETAFDVHATLAVLRVSDQMPEPEVAVSDSLTALGAIAVGGTVTGDRFAFTLGPSVDPAQILLRVSWLDAYGPVRTELLDVVAPPVPDSLIAYGSPTSLVLNWRKPAASDVRGYDIFRSANQGGPFVRVNAYTADGAAVYEDSNLPALTRFYYRVAARDSSFNQGPLSGVFSGSTNPPYMAGWPIELGQQSQSSLQLANTAGGSDYEVFTAADYQYGWHAGGTEIVDGDNDPRTSGVYALQGYNNSKGFSATCALGDMNGDGTVEVANVGWSVTEAYVWNNQGQLLPGWPHSVIDDFNWPSPVMADLDLDGDLELIVWAAKGGRLFAWNYDGTEVADGDNDPSTNGVLTPRVLGASFCYSTPAVANLDADPQPEIVFCVNLSSDNSGGIYVVNGNGTAVPGWPVFTGGPGTPSQITASPAIADLDRDGANEVVVASERNGGRVHVLRNDGTSFPGWPKDVPALTSQVRTSSPVLADLDGDTFLDVIFAGSDGRLWAWSRNGGVLAGFPVVFYPEGGEATQSTPSVGDLDGDGQLEIVLGDEKGRVHGFNHDGTPVAGFPIQLGGEVRSTPIIWDIDNDGLIEVAVVGWDSNVYIWDLPAEWNPTRIPWPFFRHDVANTGYVGSDVLPDAIGELPGGAGALPRLAAVYPARPNPFNPRTTIPFDVPGPGRAAVRLAIYDVEGRVVARLVEAELPAGRHAVEWDGRGAAGERLATGVYFYRMAIGDFVATRKLALVK